MINKVVNSIKQRIDADLFDFLSHAKNYITADFFSLGIAFISIPIFTRLLTPDDYGILAIFNSLIPVSVIFFGLETRGAVVRYFHEKGSIIGDFLGSNLFFLFIWGTLILSVLLLFRTNFSSFFNISSSLFSFGITIALISIPINIFLSYLQASKQSKQYSILSVTQHSLITIIAIVWIYFLKEEKYLGKVYSQIVITTAIAFFIGYRLFRIINFKFSLSHIKYNLKFGIPLIPHTLSTFILVYFDRIIINQLNGAEDTGLYSFAYNVGMIIQVVIMGMNKSWVPIFYENLKNDNFKNIHTLAINYSRYIYFAALVLIFFSHEIVILMADKSYYSALSVVPIIVLAYVSVFMYTLYANYSFYRKKTVLISVATSLSCIVNIGLNYLLIPKFGYVAAAYTTLASYFLLFILHFMNVRFILKEKHIIPVTKIIFNFLIILIIGLVFPLITDWIGNYVLILTLKVFLVIAFAYYFIVRNMKIKIQKHRL